MMSLPSVMSTATTSTICSSARSWSAKPSSISAARTASPIQTSSPLPAPTTDDQYGFSVAGKGDINHDGVNDFLIGAPSGDISGTNDVGLVYVYTGSVTPTFAVTLTGESINSNFGRAAAIIGHTNDDDYDDIAVGAWKGGISETGRVFVYAGRLDTENLTSTVILEGENSGDGFGFDVAGAGDVNGDGYDDLLVGALQNDDAGNDAGKVYLYLGSADGITDTNYMTLTGPVDSQFGTAVAGAGDVNGDGYADILVGADVADTDILTNTGSAYLYLGSPSGPVTPPALVLNGEGEDNRFGFAVAGGGDLNGDGFDDFGVGAHQFNLSDDVGDLQAGKAYAYGGCLGSPQPTAIFSDTGRSGFDSYGRSLAIAGDLNDDGVDDLVVGAFGANDAAPVPTAKSTLTTASIRAAVVRPSRSPKPSPRPKTRWSVAPATPSPSPWANRSPIAMSSATRATSP